MASMSATGVPSLTEESASYHVEVGVDAPSSLASRPAQGNAREPSGRARSTSARTRSFELAGPDENELHVGLPRRGEMRGCSDEGRVAFYRHHAADDTDERDTVRRTSSRRRELPPMLGDSRRKGARSKPSGTTEKRSGGRRSDIAGRNLVDEPVVGERHQASRGPRQQCLLDGEHEGARLGCAEVAAENTWPWNVCTRTGTPARSAHRRPIAPAFALCVWTTTGRSRRMTRHSSHAVRQVADRAQLSTERRDEHVCSTPYWPSR